MKIAGLVLLNELYYLIYYISIVFILLRFLLLLSDGLYKSLQEATGTEQVNKDIAQMVVEQVSNIYLFFFKLGIVIFK